MEKIVCSAIKFQRLDDERWCIYTGLRHADTFYRMFLDNIQYNRKTCITGFMTDNDRFVDRYEAKKIAIAANQIKDCEYAELYSEDIWPDDFIDITKIK